MSLSSAIKKFIDESNSEDKMEGVVEIANYLADEDGNHYKLGRGERKDLFNEYCKSLRKLLK